MNIYCVTHSRIIEQTCSGQDINDSKLIGFFSSIKKAESVIELYRNLVGFMDYPNGFNIEKRELNYDDFDFIGDV